MIWPPDPKNFLCEDCYAREAAVLYPWGRYCGRCALLFVEAPRV